MSVIMRKLIVAASTALLMLCAMTAAAHHSAAQFDFSTPVTVEGVVKKFTIRNPHASFVLEVTDEKGTRDVEYEGHSASHFYRAGYTRDLLHKGDKIAILIAPRHDGEDGGFIISFTVNGKTVIGFGNRSPETGKPANNE